jgi:hypothetical protein
MMQEINRKKVDVRKQAINSAAIQDHLIRGLKIGDPFKKPLSQMMPSASSIVIGSR